MGSGSGQGGHGTILFGCRVPPGGLPRANPEPAAAPTAAIVMIVMNVAKLSLALLFNAHFNANIIRALDHSAPPRKLAVLKVMQLR
jgi:hypothetical protein